MPSPFDLKKNILSPFDAKTIQTESGEKALFKRGHGIKSACVVGNNEIIFVIPYAWVKITAIEVVNGSIGDTVSLYVLDTTIGNYSTIPNFVLNQFAFDLNVAEKFYSKKSEYDADLYLGMQVKVVYNSIDSKTIGLNFDLNEVK